jgi:membrane protein required for colicin V production
LVSPNLQWVDTLILVWVAYHALRGLWRGMIRMLCDVVAIGAAIFAAVQGAAPTNAILSNWVPMPYNIGIWGSGLVIAGIVFVIVSSVGKFLNTVTSAVGLGPLNRLAGFFFGCIKGFGLIIPLALILNLTAPKLVADSIILSHYAQIMSHFKGLSLPNMELPTQEGLAEKFLQSQRQSTDTLSEKSLEALLPTINTRLQNSRQGEIEAAIKHLQESQKR